MAGDDPVGFVVSLNLHRRHLDESQRAMAAARLATAKDGNPNWTNSSSCKFTNGQASKKLNVGTTAIKEAKKVQSQGIPELIKKVENGDLSVSLAAQLAALPEEEQHRVLMMNKDAALKTEPLSFMWFTGVSFDRRATG